MLKVEDIRVMYAGAVLVLKGVSMEVGDRSIVALLGANGAGKSTLIKTVSGIISIEEGKITRGNIIWDGQSIPSGMSTQDIARMGILAVPEGRYVFEHLSVYENLILGAHFRHDKADIKKDLDMVYDYFPRLREVKHQAGYLSGGERQMLVVGRALMASPRLILLDEPTMGLSPILVDEIMTIVKRVREERQTSVLLVEQNAKVALEIADYGYVMENGKIVLDGPADSLKHNEDIKEFYLGLSQVSQKKSYRYVKHYRRRKRWL